MGGEVECSDTPRSSPSESTRSRFFTHLRARIAATIELRWSRLPSFSTRDTWSSDISVMMRRWSFGATLGPTTSPSLPSRESGTSLTRRNALGSITNCPSTVSPGFPTQMGVPTNLRSSQAHTTNDSITLMTSTNTPPYTENPVTTVSCLGIPPIHPLRGVRGVTQATSHCTITTVPAREPPRQENHNGQ